jgi:glyoxylase-like metal-dependent hydrolase (beta-lactamase superfamily II)
MAVKSLKVLYLGRDENMNKGKLAYGEDGKLATTGFLAFLIQTDDKNILVDAGFNPEGAAYLKSQGRAIFVEPEDYLPARLKEAAGLSMDDIDMVILTHIHRDHTGWLGQFKNAEVIAQKEDYAQSVLEPVTFINPVAPAKPYLERDIKWKLVVGDQVVMPGIALVTTPGHTMGHQAVIVDLPKTGKVMLVGDSVLDLDCLERELIPGVFVDRMQCVLTLRKIKTLAALLNAQVIPTHDWNLYQSKLKNNPTFE